MTTLVPAATRRGAATMLALALAIVAIALVSLSPARAADHKDAPGVDGTPEADINDIYAFADPNTDGNVVLILTVNPLTAPPMNTDAAFGTNVDYNLHVDGDGDLIADATVTVTFAGSPGSQTFSVAGLSADPLTGDVTAPSDGSEPNDPIVNTYADGAIQIFAGQTDDPFFFDLVGFNQYLAGPFELIPGNGLRPEGETPSDTLAGTNVSAIALSVPVSAVAAASGTTDGVIRAWSTTTLDGARVDRMAIPAINTALIPSGMKDDFNQGDPVDDAADFRPAAQAQIEGLRAALLPILGPENSGPLGDLDAATVAGALIPDVVTIDTANPLAFPNGRRLTDDVVDVALGIVLNRGAAAGVSDGVDGNDVAFRSTFPYLGAPHQPQVEPTATPTSEPTAAPTQVPPTATPTTPAPLPPPTGSGLANDGGGLGWEIPALIAAAIAIAAAAGLALRKRVTS